MSAEKSAKDISACIRAPCAEENKEDIHYAAAHTVAENNGRKEAGTNNCHQKDKAEMFEREFFFGNEHRNKDDQDVNKYDTDDRCAYEFIYRNNLQNRRNKRNEDGDKEAHAHQSL